MKTQIIVFLAGILLTTISVYSFSGNGSGTEADPYQICNVKQLQEMNDELDAHYILMNDIDASETSEWNVGDHDDNPETPDSAMGFIPIGSYNYTDATPIDGFTGSLDGQNYTISHLLINRPQEAHIGLFGCIADSSYGHDVNVEDAIVAGNWRVGVFVGVVFAFTKENGILIEGCSSSGFAKGYNTIGSFCGSNSGNYYYSSAHIYNKSTIINCYSTGDASGIGDLVGGFCGVNNGIIIHCYSTGNINGRKCVGGFFGLNYNGRIRFCYSTGDIKGNNYSVGGFGGKNENGDIDNCYSTGDAIGEEYLVGGFCGLNYAQSHGSSIRNCYSTGNVYSEINDVGGFCGGNGSNRGGSAYTGKCYWDTQTSSCLKDGYQSYANGKTTAEMMMQATFVDWDFENIWCMVEGETYPHLQAIEDCDNLISVKENQLLTNSNINIFPNPVINRLIVSADYLFENKIQIFNLLGVEVWSQTALSNIIEIDVSTLVSGIYFLRVGNETKMFVKE